MNGNSGSRLDRRIRSLRPPKPPIDPWRPLDALVERERCVDGALRSVAVIFLAGRECPFTCVFCDLWRSTLNEATPLGSLPRQIDRALESLGIAAHGCTAAKLYNASNFFDPLAVPEADLDAIAQRVERFERLTVESHPRMVGPRALAVAAGLPCRVEVAMGLESIHPRVLPRLNKKMTLGDFERAAQALRANQVAVRAFVLLGVPFLPAEAQVEWAVRSAEHAISIGAERVSLIPVRGGNGQMERLASRGEWTPPSLEQLEAALEALVGRSSAVVSADRWDLETLGSCGECLAYRSDRLETMNLTGRVAARRACHACGWG